MKIKNWRVTFLQLCIDHNASAEFTPTECWQLEDLYGILRNGGSHAARRRAEAMGGRCAELWWEYQEAMK